jgi:DNA-binding transcriptional LysR family regulator
MTLEQLRIFVAVAERLHMTQAAAALNVTQSAASAAVQALETRLGLKLFDRVGRHIELTEAGRVFLPEAKAVLAQLARAAQVVDDLAGLERGRLVLWASQTIAGYWLPRHITRFKKKHPKIEISLVISNTAGVSKAVKSGEADLGFVEGHVEDPLLVKIDLGSDQLVLVIGCEAPAAWREVSEPSDLLELDWVLREAGSGTRQIFEDVILSRGISPTDLNVVLELPSNEAVVNAVEAGAGASVLSRLVARSGLQAGGLIELNTVFPMRHFYVLRHGDRHRTAAEAAFVTMLKKASPA